MYKRLDSLNLESINVLGMRENSSDNALHLKTLSAMFAPERRRRHLLDATSRFEIMIKILMH